MSVRSRCLRLGLTGGIGSGKTTVAAALQELGASVIDADAISRAATSAQGAAIAAIRTCFGADFVTADGALDRDRMRALVFSQPEAKQRLESIVHPIVRATMAEQTAQAQTSGSPCIVYDIPLLVESGHWREGFDRIVVVDCAPQTQSRRVQQRNGLSLSAIQSILTAQAPRLDRLRAADAVLCNDNISIADLKNQVRALWVRFGL